MKKGCGEGGTFVMSELMNVCGVFMDMWGGFELAENQSKAKRGKPLKQTVFSSKEVRLRFVNDNLSCIPIANHKQCYSLKFT